MRPNGLKIGKFASINSKHVIQALADMCISTLMVVNAIRIGFNSSDHR